MESELALEVGHVADQAADGEEGLDLALAREYDVLIVVSGDNLLERKSIDALRNLIINLQFVDGMAGEVSLFSAREAA